MNFWLLASAALLALIALLHSVMGERQIFRPWAKQAPPGVRHFHRQILRATWHLPSLLGASQAVLLILLARGAAADLPAASLLQDVLMCLGAGVAACGLLVLWMTRARHPGGTALLIAAVLMLIGLLKVGPR